MCYRVEDLSLLFYPRSVAIIGISRSRPSLGQMILDNLEESGYDGNIFLVNPKADMIKNYKVYNQLDVLPAVDLAIILTPARFVAQTMQQLSGKCRFVSIITAGFDDILTNELLAIATAAGIRIVGPNSMGTYAHHVSASFSPIIITPGNLCYISQSGSIIAVVQELMAKNFGFSTFISLGNKIDITEIDVLPFAAQNSSTSVIAGYLESFSYPEKLREILLKITPHKPVLLVKGGRTDEGSHAVSSHTGALAGNFRLTRSLLDYCGVMTLPTIEQQITIARFIDKFGVTPHTGIVTISSAGGPGVLAADEIVEANLPLAKLQENTVIKLGEVIPPFGNAHNPLDLVADAGIDRYIDTINIVRDDPGVSTIIVIIVHPVLIDTEPLLVALDALKLPIIVAYLGPEYASFDHYDNLIVYPTTKEIIGILAKINSYSHWKVNSTAFQDYSHLQQMSRINMSLDNTDVHQLLRSYGFTYPDGLTTADYTVASKWFEQQQSVVMKLSHPTFSHKTESGGVILGVQTDEQFEHGWNKLQQIYETANIVPEQRKVELQTYYNGGIEVVVGALRDKQFGHFLLFGTGGTMVELFDDTVFLPSPLSRTAVGEALNTLRLNKLLVGFRGSQTVDRDKLVDEILRLDMIIQYHPQIRELDINPLYIIPQTQQFVVLDARMEIDS